MGYLTEHDDLLIRPEYVSIEFAPNQDLFPTIGNFNQFPSENVMPNKGVRVIFQFPVRITSDNRTGDWTSTPTPATVELVVVSNSAAARAFNLETEYAVIHPSSAGDGVGRWTPYKVMSQIQILRGYYMRWAASTKKLQRNVGCKMRMSAINGFAAGTPKMSCRLNRVNIVYSGPQMTDIGPTGHEYPFYMFAKVQLEVVLWSQGNLVRMDGSCGPPVKASGVKGGVSQQDFLEPCVPHNWF